MTRHEIQMDDKIKEAARILSGAKNIVGFTGAGMSAESGIPPFREKTTNHTQKRDNPGSNSQIFFYFLIFSIAKPFYIGFFRIFAPIKHDP